ncbi:hypothetical protein HU200_029192 [Digitaria exilis]|uniref:Uncharacterized protein n=1 Tax=Digitaria exilis TaxID=1010633 RepID=A0A835ET52_9POAL|nr:hypothetical protein HU200_029192 [Digitaria exilis]CAB3489358.1 unnamed protein product [Digitaria exilis]
MAGDDNVTVHVEWLARRLTQQQEDAAATEQHRVMLSTHRVSRVPDHVRIRNPDAYTPGLVTIGPLHAEDGLGRLRPGKRLKMAYLHSLISRGHPDPSSHLAVIQGYVRLVAAREREARAMYAAEDVEEISAEDFVQMLVLDGCFIIEHLVNVATGREEQTLHATPYGPAQLSVDIVLAENQIPFFVLVDLIGSTRLPEFDTTGYQPPVLLMKLVLYYLAGEKGSDRSDVLPPANGVCHILHLLHQVVTSARTTWQPPPRIQDSTMLKLARQAGRFPLSLPLQLMVPLLYPILPDECKWSARYGPESVPSASDVKGMLLRLEKTHGGGGGGVKSSDGAGIVSVLGPVPLAVKLDQHGVLRLAQLKIEFRTMPLLLNLMAFERYFCEMQAGDVLAYTWFMAKMVPSAEDAAELVAAEVLRGSAVGNESNADVVRFFRDVGAACEGSGQRELEKSYLRETLLLFEERTQHAKRVADVKRYYVTVPWRLITAFVTVITTVTSILQTLASFKQKPG